jgi:hypothetical protein
MADRRAMFCSLPADPLRMAALTAAEPLDGAFPVKVAAPPDDQDRRQL